MHLTFAQRAYELADWYRRRGATVILGGLHVLSCPEECAPHADCLALGDGVQLWPRILADVERNDLQPRYVATHENDYSDDPAPRRAILPRRSFLTTTSLIATRGCHNRCGFCYLSTEGLRMPYRMRTPQQVADEFLAGRTTVRGVRGQQSWVPARLSSFALQGSSTFEQDLERCGLDRRHRRSVADSEHGVGRLHGSFYRVRITHRRQSC